MGDIKSVLLAIIIIIVISVSWLFFKTEPMREEPLLDAKLSLPLEAELGTAITMTITATNNHTRPVTLDSIDISDSIIAGFQIISINPRSIDTTTVPSCNMRSWEFGKTVLPGQSITISFELKPVAKGRFMGDIDICNPNQDFVTLYADIIIKETGG